MVTWHNSKHRSVFVYKIIYVNRRFRSQSSLWIDVKITLTISLWYDPFIYNTSVYGTLQFITF